MPTLLLPPPQAPPIIPTEIEAVQRVADELRGLFEGVTDPETAERLLWQWAKANGFRRSGAGISGAVYLRDDVVVKANFTASPDDAVPFEYRPTQVQVWHSNQLYRRGVVVQPRYRMFANGVDQDRTFTPLAVTMLAQGLDAHTGNWGLRADGSPVLFDW